MSDERVFLVGGAVRDMMLGLPVKDFDFAVEAESFDAMREMVVRKGGRIFVETPEFLTIRAYDVTGELTGISGETADFVLCRKDIGSSDSRHPDRVEVGTIFDDLARRDFTVNAMAIEAGDTFADGNSALIDPFDGESDLQNHLIRTVGDPADRMREDALRAIRAMRFAITKGFEIADDLDWFILTDPDLPEMLNAVSDERKREELHKCFMFDSRATIRFISRFRIEMQEAILPDSIWLLPTSKKRK